MPANAPIGPQGAHGETAKAKDHAKASKRLFAGYKKKGISNVPHHEVKYAEEYELGVKLAMQDAGLLKFSAQTSDDVDAGRALVGGVGGGAMGGILNKAMGNTRKFPPLPVPPGIGRVGTKFLGGLGKMTNVVRRWGLPLMLAGLGGAVSQQKD